MACGAVKSYTHVIESTMHALLKVQAILPANLVWPCQTLHFICLTVDTDMQPK